MCCLAKLTIVTHQSAHMYLVKYCQCPRFKALNYLSGNIPPSLMCVFYVNFKRPTDVDVEVFQTVLNMSWICLCEAIGGVCVCCMTCGYTSHSLFPLAAMQLPLRLRSTSSRHCPSTPASLSAPVALKLELSLRSRCASAGHCASTPANLSVSCPFIPQRGSSRVAMCHRAVNAASCLKTACRFAFSQHDRPAIRPRSAPGLSRDGLQRRNKAESAASSNGCVCVDELVDQVRPSAHVRLRRSFMDDKLNGTAFTAAERLQLVFRQLAALTAGTCITTLELCLYDSSYPRHHHPCSIKGKEVERLAGVLGQCASLSHLNLRQDHLNLERNWIGLIGADRLAGVLG